MQLRHVAIENVRSFLERAEMSLPDNISILIGPNGGGKTNFLDTVVVVLRRYIFKAMYAAPNPQPDGREVFDFRENDQLSQLQLPKHNAGETTKQENSISIAVTKSDLENMSKMKAEAARLNELSKRQFRNFPLEATNVWDIEGLTAGSIHNYKIVDGILQQSSIKSSLDFLQYLQLFEIY